MRMFISLADDGNNEQTIVNDDGETVKVSEAIDKINAEAKEAEEQQKKKESGSSDEDEDKEKEDGEEYGDLEDSFDSQKKNAADFANDADLDQVKERLSDPLDGGHGAKRTLSRMPEQNVNVRPTSHTPTNRFDTR